jgi:hypothetical protein
MSVYQVPHDGAVIRYHLHMQMQMRYCRVRRSFRTYRLRRMHRLY